MGTKKQTESTYDALGKDNKNANEYRQGEDGITKELISGLSPDFTTVNWNVDQPGFFTDEHPHEGKEKYTNYALKLNKTGNTYKLTGVKRPDESIFNCNDDGSWFLPLQEDTLKEDQVSDGKKFYFGMRYDINFKLGDYVGPLKYSFTGDDDLWVLLDGKVVIDLGGIHDALSTTTDLWKKLGFEEGVGATSDDAKKQNHRLTILYMERGGYRSNCKMEFTIPDPKFVDVKNVPLAEITINKTNSNNKPLPGAMFRLTNDNDSSDTYPIATTDGKGQIKFDNLKAGVYTLTEAVAPNGYVALKETYKIKVTVNNDKATAKLYKSDGTAEVEGNNIINYTETEEAEKNLTSSKSAKVVDYENRTYQIDLNAEMTGKEADQKAKNASVVLVLDASNSMNELISGNTKKIVALRNAATQFVNTLSDKSADSEVSIIWYSGDEGKNSLTTLKEFTKLNESGVSVLNAFINGGRNIGGETPMGSALEAAYNQLRNATKGNDKYVLFMTDGMPGYYDDGHNYSSSSSDCMTANKAVDYANRIKDSNDGKAVLYTVGVGLKDADTFMWTAGHSKQSYNSHNKDEHASTKSSDFLVNNIASGSDHAYNTSNVTDLVNKFELIAGKIGDLYTVQPARIVDVIDARFELTEDSVNALADKIIAGEKGKVNESKTEITITWKKDDNVVGKVTIVKNPDGPTTITWTGAAAKIGNKAATEEADKGWKASFKVKAKDDFIGGNMIPTNGADSGIYLDGGGVKEFEQPSVNVKLLDLNIENKEITVFKGDPISPQNFRNELAETLNIKQLDVGENQEFEYTYPGSKDAVGKFICTYEVVKGNINEHTATEVGTEVEQYKLTVTYHPYSLDERKTILSNTLVKEPTLEGGTVVSSDLTKEGTGTYKVNVIAGQIEITKKLSGEDKAQKNASFTFKIYKVTTENGCKVEEELVTSPEKITATIKQGDNVAKFGNDTSVTITGLSKGEYVVKETSYNGYTLETAVSNESKTNCLAVNNTTTKDVTFTIGTDTNNKNALEANELKAEKVNYATYAGPGCVGVADFTNKEITADVNFVKVDATKGLNGNTITISGVEFELYKANESWEKGDKVKDNIVSGESGKFSLEKLLPGKYLLVETKAGTGYSLPADPWRIEISSTGKDVEVYKTNTTEIQPTTTGSMNAYQIENARIYSLPSSGGPGIYGFTISGVAFITAALLLFINNKRKEGKITG